MHGAWISEEVKIPVQCIRCRKLAWRHDGVKAPIGLKKDNRRIVDVAYESRRRVVQIEAVRIGGKYGCVQGVNAAIELRPMVDD